MRRYYLREGYFQDKGVRHAMSTISDPEYVQQSAILRNIPGYARASKAISEWQRPTIMGSGLRKWASANPGKAALGAGLIGTAGLGAGLAARRYSQKRKESAAYDQMRMREEYFRDKGVRHAMSMISDPEFVQKSTILRNIPGYARASRAISEWQRPTIMGSGVRKWASANPGKAALGAGLIGTAGLGAGLAARRYSQKRKESGGYFGGRNVRESWAGDAWEKVKGAGSKLWAGTKSLASRAKGGLDRAMGWNQPSTYDKVAGKVGEGWEYAKTKGRELADYAKKTYNEIPKTISFGGSSHLGGDKFAKADFGINKNVALAGAGALAGGLGGYAAYRGAKGLMHGDKKNENTMNIQHSLAATLSYVLRD